MSPDSPAYGAEATAAQRRAAARRARRVHRQPVSRAAEALPAGLTLLALLLGLVLRQGDGALGGAGAGLVVTAIGLELYTRGLGAYVMREKPPAAVLLAVLGSPAVLLHAVLARRGTLAPEPEGLALLVPVAVIVLLFAVANA